MECPFFYPFSNLATIFVAKSQTELKELPVTCKAWPSMSPSVTRFLRVFQAPVTQTKILPTSETHSQFMASLFIKVTPTNKSAPGLLLSSLHFLVAEIMHISALT